MSEPMATVYSYYSPQIRNIVESSLVDLNQGKAGRNHSIHWDLSKNITPGLDDLHLDLMAKYERFTRSEGVIGLESLPHSYYTNGSSEAIFHLLSNYRGRPIYQFDGEYQGYSQYAASLGFTIKTVQLTRPDLDNFLPGLPSGILIVSNPNSKNGNILNWDTINAAASNGEHQIILDLAYIGMTQAPLNINILNSRVIAVVGSMSKLFGLYYFRIGFCYSCMSLPSLFGNKWFKNALSIRIGESVLDNLDIASYKKSMADRQRRVLKIDRGLGDYKPSDAWLLAYQDIDNVELYKISDENKKFLRGKNTLRVCLTSYYQTADR